MQKGRNFEKEIEKVIEYIKKIGFHGHKNHPKRLQDGTYLEGESFDYEIFLPNRHDCFDAKQCKSDTWHILKKDIKQTNELKKCKNAGCKSRLSACKSTERAVREIDDITFMYVCIESPSIVRHKIKGIHA